MSWAFFIETFHCIWQESTKPTHRKLKCEQKPPSQTRRVQSPATDYRSKLQPLLPFVFNLIKSKESELAELIKLILLKHDRVSKKKQTAIVWTHLLHCYSWRKERRRNPLTAIEIQTTQGCVPAYFGEKVKLSWRCSFLDVMGCWELPVFCWIPKLSNILCPSWNQFLFECQTPSPVEARF